MNDMPTGTKVIDDKSKAVQNTKNRIPAQFIIDQIADKQFLSSRTTPHMTIVLVTMKNGFVVIGQSTPADPLNYDAELGKEYALQHAIGQLWPLLAFSLRDQMTETSPYKLEPYFTPKETADG